MFTGRCTLKLRLSGNDSIKGKRQVPRSLITRLRRKFNVLAAEIAGIDRYQTIVVGVDCVSKDAYYGTKMIDAVVRFVEQQQHLDVELVEVEQDLLDGD